MTISYRVCGMKLMSFTRYGLDLNALGFYDSWFQQFASISLGGDHHQVFLGLKLIHFFRARMRRANCTNATAAQSSKQLECSGYQQQAAAKEVPLPSQTPSICVVQVMQESHTNITCEGIIRSDETPVLTLAAGDVRSFDALCESCGLQLV